MEMQYFWGFYFLTGTTLVSSGPLALFNRCPRSILWLRQFLGLEVDPNSCFVSCWNWQCSPRSVLNLYHSSSIGSALLKDVLKRPSYLFWGTIWPLLVKEYWEQMCALRS
jgi:hypothetical protein